MECEKCGSSGMERRKLFRSSGYLVVASAVLLVAALFATALGVLLVLVPDTVIRELESTDRTVLMDYHFERARTFFIVVLLGFGVAGSIVGLLLLRRRKVWRCRSCEFAFDRT